MRNSRRFNGRGIGRTLQRGTRRSTAMLAALVLLVAAPATAEVFTISLVNGTTFESRYQPKQAAWDSSLLEFLDETGLKIALPKSLVSEVTAQSETKGFGRVIDTNTLDLGFAPNDLPEQVAAQPQSPVEQAFSRSYDQQQFGEPVQAGSGRSGGGVPIFGLGGSGGGFGGFQGGAPAPAAPSPPAAPPSPAPGGAQQ